jgi:transposase
MLNMPAKHKNGRIYRVLYVCRKTGKKINADINAALNIARRQDIG